MLNFLDLGREKLACYKTALGAKLESTKTIIVDIVYMFLFILIQTFIVFGELIKGTHSLIQEILKTSAHVLKQNIKRAIVNTKRILTDIYVIWTTEERMVNELQHGFRSSKKCVFPLIDNEDQQELGPFAIYNDDYNDYNDDNLRLDELKILMNGADSGIDVNLVMPHINCNSKIKLSISSGLLEIINPDFNQVDFIEYCRNLDMKRSSRIKITGKDHNLIKEKKKADDECVTERNDSWEEMLRGEDKENVQKLPKRNLHIVPSNPSIIIYSASDYHLAYTSNLTLLSPQQSNSIYSHWSGRALKVRRSLLSHMVKDCKPLSEIKKPAAEPSTSNIEDLFDANDTDAGLMEEHQYHRHRAAFANSFVRDKLGSFGSSGSWKGLPSSSDESESESGSETVSKKNVPEIPSKREKPPSTPSWQKSARRQTRPTYDNRWSNDIDEYLGKKDTMSEILEENASLGVEFLHQYENYGNNISKYIETTRYFSEFS